MRLRKPAARTATGNGISLRQRHDEVLAYLDSPDAKSPELLAVEKILRG